MIVELPRTLHPAFLPEALVPPAILIKELTKPLLQPVELAAFVTTALLIALNHEIPFQAAMGSLKD